MGTNDVTVAPPRRGLVPPTALRLRALALVRSADVQAVAVLMFFVALMAAVSWRKWGTPEIDAGVDLTTAAQMADGDMPYEDLRYFYGPLGIYALAGAFKVFGATLTVAFALGLAMTLAIVVTFYALARQLLRPLPAALAAAVLVPIAFSGTQFNFVLPHTNSATFGLLLVLLELLAMARRRPALAGLALGFTCLTRVEFAAAAIIAGAAWLLGTWRAEGRGEMLRAGLRLGAPALAVPLAVYAALAAAVGTDRLLWENLWPSDFLRIAGFNAYREWTPFDAASVASSLARLFVYAALFTGLVASAVGFAAAPDRPRRLRALWPMLAAGLGTALLFAAWRVSAAFPDARVAVEEECKQLMLGMSWLPMLAFGAAALVAYRFVRGRSAPLSGSWPLDLALVAVAGLLCARAYDQFTMDSAAPYYAAPAVLLLALLHERVAERWPGARLAALGALGAVAAGIALYVTVALYGDKTTPITTSAGSYIGLDATAKAQQRAIDYVRQVAPDELVLAAPADGGVYFLAGRKSPLYDMAFLPGSLDSRADERAAIAELRRQGLRYAVISTRDTTAFSSGRFGSGYNRLFGSYLTSGRLVESIGRPDAPAAGGGYPSKGFRVYELDVQGAR